MVSISLGIPVCVGDCVVVRCSLADRPLAIARICSGSFLCPGNLPCFYIGGVSGEWCRYLQRIGCRGTLVCNGDLFEFSPRVKGTICSDEDEEPIEQPILDDVPGHVHRQMPHGNDMIKKQEWGSLLRWLNKKLEEDPGCILATSPDTCKEGRQNLLGTLGGFRPDVGSDQSDHKECALLIVRRFYRAGLLNMKVTRSKQTALLNCIAKGNIEVASLLLQWGAGFPPWFLPGRLIRILCPAGGHAL